MKKYFIFLFAALTLGAVNAQSKIAHLNSQDVMDAMPTYQKAVKDLEAFQKELNIELQTMIEDYQKAVEEYQVKEPDLSPVRLQIEQEKLAKKQQAIQERQQAIQGEIQAYSRELNAPIVYFVELAVKNIADRNGYDYVMDETMLLISNGTNITKEVTEEVLKLENNPPPPPQEEIKSISPPPQEEIIEK